MCKKYSDCLARAAYANKMFNCKKCTVSPDASLQPLKDVPRVRRQLVADDGMVGTIDAAKILGITPTRLQYLRYKGIGPEHSQVGKIGTAVMYEVAALNRFLAEQLQKKVKKITEVSTPAAAKILGISTGTLQKMRKRGAGPRCRLAGNKFMYQVKDLDAYKKGD